MLLVVLIAIIFFSLRGVKCSVFRSHFSKFSFQLREKGKRREVREIEEKGFKEAVLSRRRDET